MEEPSVAFKSEENQNQPSLNPIKLQSSFSDRFKQANVELSNRELELDALESHIKSLRLNFFRVNKRAADDFAKKLSIINLWNFPAKSKDFDAALFRYVSLKVSLASSAVSWFSQKVELLPFSVRKSFKRGLINFSERLKKDELLVEKANDSLRGFQGWLDLKQEYGENFVKEELLAARKRLFELHPLLENVYFRWFDETVVLTGVALPEEETGVEETMA